MLPKAQRLTTKDIASLSHGKSVFGTLISLRFSPAKAAKFSVTVSKKVQNTAVGRNSLRRKVYKCVPKARSVLKSPIYGLIMPKRECMDAAPAAIEAELAALFEKASK